MTVPFGKLRAKMLADPKVRAAYDAAAPEFELAHELIAARVRANQGDHSRNLKSTFSSSRSTSRQPCRR